MARINLFKRIAKLESTIEVLEQEIANLKKDNKIRATKKRLDDLELKLEDFNNGMKLLQETSTKLDELLSIYKDNAQKQEQLQKELQEYWDFNK